MKEITSLPQYRSEFFFIIKVFSLESFAVSMDENHVTNDCLHENVSLLEETIESAEAAENEIQRIA